MIERVQFKNFKALKEAELKLGAFNLIVGPNGSGKSSVLQALEALADPGRTAFERILTAGCGAEKVGINVSLNQDRQPEAAGAVWLKGQAGHYQGAAGGKELSPSVRSCFKGIRAYALEPAKLALPIQAHQTKELNRDGSNLVGALTNIRDRDEDAYNRLRAEFQRWLPEFDSIIFETTDQGYRSLKLRQKSSHQAIPASEVSEGSLLALALLTIVHQPLSLTVIGLEEPDRGLHPRLLRDVQDALYRMSFPDQFGLQREPVQVIATTHSPHFLDLFRDHTEQVIVAEKHADGTASFKSLAEDPELREMIGDAPLGEVWYSGILGGVPALH